jgi:hypothetical protein
MDAVVATNPVPRRNFSKLGVTSFLMALGFPLFLLLLFAVSLAIEGRVNHENVSKFDWFTICCLIIGGPIVHFAGLMLGIAGAFQKVRNRLFAVLGIVLNGLFVIAAAIICILALSLVVASLGRVT